jgi:hypothetical protein
MPPYASDLSFNYVNKVKRLEIYAIVRHHPHSSCTHTRLTPQLKVVLKPQSDFTSIFLTFHFFPCRHQWLLSFYTYPANCLALYLLSSMAFTATVCQVYVSGSGGNRGCCGDSNSDRANPKILLQRLWLFYLTPLQPNQDS